MNKFKALIVSRDELLSVLDEVTSSIHSTVIPSLDDLIAITKTNTELSESIIFSDLKTDTDDVIFSRLKNVVIKYNDIIPNLKQKITDKLPETMSQDASNVNVRIALSVVSEGVFLTDGLIDAITYTMGRFYKKGQLQFDERQLTGLSNKVLTLVKLLPELEEANIKTVVNTIGEIPTIRTLRSEKTSVVPLEMVMSFVSDNLNIKDLMTKNFVYKLLEGGSSKGQVGFTGNPIFHLSLFLIDLQDLRLQSLREKKRLLELKILEMKNNDDLSEAIAYHEKRLSKLTLKIDKISRV